MTDRNTPSTNAPAEPERVELDLRDHDNGRDAAAVPDELVSRQEAAQRFGLDLDVLRGLEKLGELTPACETSGGPVYYAVAELERVVSGHTRDEHAVEVDAVDVDAIEVDTLEVPSVEADSEERRAGLVLPPEELWEMVEEARRDARQACTRATALESEVKVLRAMVERLMAERGNASTDQQAETTAERASRWSSQWEQHELEQQRLVQQRQAASTRGSWWPRKGSG